MVPTGLDLEDYISNVLM